MKTIRLLLGRLSSNCNAASMLKSFRQLNVCTIPLTPLTTLKDLEDSQSVPWVLLSLVIQSTGSKAQVPNVANIFVISGFLMNWRLLRMLCTFTRLVESRPGMVGVFFHSPCSPRDSFIKSHIGYRSVIYFAHTRERCESCRVDVEVPVGKWSCTRWLAVSALPPPETPHCLSRQKMAHLPSLELNKATTFSASTAEQSLEIFDTKIGIRPKQERGLVT
jgi:hypothetical protein